MSKTHRLLNAGEQTSLDSLIWDAGIHKWIKCNSVFIIGAGSPPIINPIAPPEWIPIKERAPEFPCVYGDYNKDGEWLTAIPRADSAPNGWTYWHPIPKAPAPPQSEDDKAFEAAMKVLYEKYGAASEKMVREVFSSGVAHGKGGK